MYINSSIFKAYDIRGVYPKDINEKVAARIAGELAAFVAAKSRKKKVVIALARDVRSSSPSLAHYVKEGLLHAGADVIDAGIVTTPMFYFCLGRLKADGGVMITASHNPAEYNGFKIFGKNHVSISMGFGLEEFREKVMRPEGDIVLADRGSYREVRLIDEYVSFLKKKISLGSHPVKVAVDAGGGSAALVLPALLHTLKISYMPLFFEVDGSFSRHSPNPLDKRSQTHIKKELAAGEYQLGVIFDCDADRVIFFDEQGEEVRPDFMLAILADEVLKKKKGESFVVELTSSKAVKERIEQKGGRVAICRVGRTYMRDRMLKTKSIYGAEISGHFFFRDFYYCDSAILALLKVIELLSVRGVALSSLARPLASYVSSGQISIEVGSKEDVMREVDVYYRGQGRRSDLDGVTVEFDNWWFNIRPSNTESVVRYMIEADSEKVLEEKSKELEKVIARGN